MFRLHPHSVSEQGFGDGTGPLREHLALRKHDRRRQRQHREEPRGPGTGQDHLPGDLSVCSTTAGGPVNGPVEAMDHRRRNNMQLELFRLSLQITNELGYVPLSSIKAEMFFEIFTQGNERSSINGGHQSSL